MTFPLNCIVQFCPLTTTTVIVLTDWLKLMSNKISQILYLNSTDSPPICQFFRSSDNYFMKSKVTEVTDLIIILSIGLHIENINWTIFSKSHWTFNTKVSFMHIWKSWDNPNKNS